MQDCTRVCAGARPAPVGRPGSVKVHSTTENCGRRPAGNRGKRRLDTCNSGTFGPLELAQSYNVNVAGDMLLCRRKTMKNRTNETSAAGRLTSTPNELRGLRWWLRAGKDRRLVCPPLMVCALLIAAASTSLPISASAAQDGSAPQADKDTIQGVVRDAAGHVVGDASVRLEHVRVPGAVVTKTNAEGSFAFAAVGTGTFQVRAEKSGRQSGTKTVVVEDSSDRKHVDLILEDRETAKENSSPSVPVMEFTDKPNFTVAAVTDWTAAGGHGSDASLRTSEALTRETLTLKSDGAASKAPGSAGEIKGSESALRQALVGAPGSFKANHDLGGFYLREGTIENPSRSFEPRTSSTRRITTMNTTWPWHSRAPANFQRHVSTCRA
jgi:hypothetical protein